MGLSLKNITKKIGDVAGAVERQVNPFDGGKTASNPTAAPQAPLLLQRPAAPRSLISRVADQVNPYDNGRTFKNATPVSNDSVVHQATHNGVTNTAGNFAVKPVVNTVRAGWDAGRLLSLNVTGQGDTADANKARSDFYEHATSSLPGFVASNVIRGGQAGYNLGFKAPILDVSGHSQAAEKARMTGLQEFNQTAPGQLTSPVEVGIANTVHTSNKELAKSGLDPNATGAQKYIANPVMGGVGTYGLVEGGARAAEKVRGKVSRPTEAPVQAPIEAPTETPAVKPDTPQAEAQQVKTVRPQNPEISQPVDVSRPGFMNQLATAFIDKDSPVIRTLKKIDKTLGTNATKRFLYNSNMLRQAPGIAQHYFNNSESMTQAIGGLSRKAYKQFAEYANARREYTNATVDGLPTSKSVPELQQILNAGHEQFGGRFDALNQYYKDLAHSAHEAGLIDSETLKKYQSDNDYIRLQRDMADEEMGKLMTHRGTGKSMSIGSTVAKLKRKGSQRAALDPVHVALDYTNKIMSETMRNATSRDLIETLHKAGVSRQLVNPADVSFRRDMYQFLSDTRPGKEAVSKLLTKTNKQRRAIEGELNNLNKRGLHASLKNVHDGVPDFSVEGLGGEVGTGKAGTDKGVDFVGLEDGRVRGNDAKTIARNGDIATQERAIADAYLGENTGKPGLIREGEGTAAARKAHRAIERNKKIIQKRGTAQDHPVHDSKLGPRDTAALVRSLVSKDPSELVKLRKMISNREPKLAALIDEVTKLHDSHEAFKTARRDAWKAAADRADSRTTGRNTISYLKNGVKEVHEVPDYIKQTVDNIAPFQLNTLEKVVGAPARVLRAGATALNPVFTASNVLKDQAGSAVISSSTRDTHLNLKNVGAGLKESVKDFVGMKGDPLWEEYIKRGGDRTQYDLTRNVKNTSEIIDRKRGGRKVGFMQSMTHWVRTIEEANSVTEKATRFQNFKGIYQKSIREGASHEQAVENATMAALEHTVNFGRAGSWGRIINLVVPYSNAAIQGGRALGNAIKERPYSTTSKGFAWVGTPIAAATLWNQADPERKKVYDNISPYEKQNNLVLIRPGTKYADVKNGSYQGIIKVPLPPDIGSIFQPIRRVIEGRNGGKGANAQEIAADVTKPFVGPLDVSSKGGFVSSITPQVAKPAINQAANEDFYTGKKIVPDYMKDATTDPTKRVTKHTSSTARAIGEKLGVEPVRVDKFISDTGGKLGSFGINASDNVLKKIGKGRTDDKGNPIIGGQSVPAAFTQRFERASAIKDPNNTAAQHFAAVDAQYKNLNKNERSAYDTIHTTKVDGDQPDKTLYDASVRAGIYAKYPKVLEADNKINRDSKDPFFHLPNSQQKVIISLDSLSNDPGSNTAKELQKQNPWLQDYYDQRGKFFDSLAASGKIKTATGSTLPKAPVANADVQKQLDAYGTITDSAQKAQYLQNNPAVSDYFAQSDQYQRQKRTVLGLPQFDKYPTASADVTRKLAVYNSLPQHDGKKGGNKTRSLFLAANPDVTNYFAAASQYGLIKDAQRAVFEGEDLTDKNAAKLGGGSGGSSYSQKPVVLDPYAHTIKRKSSGGSRSVKIATPTLSYKGRSVKKASSSKRLTMKKV